MAESVGDVNGVAELPPAVEEAEKDKKKKRGRARRAKMTVSAGPVRDCTSMDGICGPAPEWLDNGNARGYSMWPPMGFNSLPNMHFNADGGLIRNPPGFASPGVTKISKSCPLPAPSSHSKSVPRNSTEKICFSKYWSDEAVEDAIKKGQAFKAIFRVNAHNRLEAYCTIDGLPVDVLINGVDAQNRAIEGDVVALMLDPVASWTRLKGLNVTCNSVTSDDSNMPFDGHKCVRKNNFHADEFIMPGAFPTNKGCNLPGKACVVGRAVNDGLGTHVGNSGYQCNGSRHSAIDGADKGCLYEQDDCARALGRISAMVNSNPLKRPTGRITAIMKKSPRRGAVIGFLGAKPTVFEEEGNKKQLRSQFSVKENNHNYFTDEESIELLAVDPKFPKMAVKFGSLPDLLKERLNSGHGAMKRELVAAQVDEWSEESPFPQAVVVRILGQGGEIEPQIAAILFENSICCEPFSSESLACLPDAPWTVPTKELQKRRDFRNICTFTIDPATASDLDDALSVEVITNEVYRIGVHIADVTYFVLPDTALDVEAKTRSTSVYMLQRKMPMLPLKLSEDVGSLIPGLDRLAFSIVWEIDRSGYIVDRWIGHSVIRSCCKLSYEFVQDIIDGSWGIHQLSSSGTSLPQLHGEFEWKDILKSLNSLHEFSLRLKEARFRDGALFLDVAKIVFSFDELGTPCDSYYSERMESCSLVEEFMLLANRSVAEVISRAFPDCALLRKHPEPNLRKLREFETFWSKRGFELDSSSAGKFHISLAKMKEKLQDDPVLFDILINYASKPMQSAVYFCTGNLSGLENDWAHYALSIPFYTHFTSPLRRYPDIIVHRTLSAALDAEEVYMNSRRILHEATKGECYDVKPGSGCFTGLSFDKDAAESKEGREALKGAAVRFKVPGTELLGEVAAYCNERKLYSRHAEDASMKLFLWAFLKKKEFVVTEARVLGLGPKFMSVYIHKFSLERRIYYDDVEALAVDWFEITSTLVLDLPLEKRFARRGSPAKTRPLRGVAFVVDPSDAFSPEEDGDANPERNNSASFVPGSKNNDRIEPLFFPLTLQILSSVPVVLHAVGGDNGPIDFGVRLYTCSYLIGTGAVN